MYIKYLDYMHLLFGLYVFYIWINIWKIVQFHVRCNVWKCLCECMSNIVLDSFINVL